MADDFIHNRAYVAGDVRFGGQCSVWPCAVIRGDIEPITIGALSNIQDCCVLHTKHGVPLTVGRGVTVGHGAILHSCTVGDGALIGMGAIVLDGAVIGENAIVAAGSVVPPGRVVEPGTVVMGNPAHFTRSVRPEELEKNAASVQEYWKEAQRCMRR